MLFCVQVDSIYIISFNPLPDDKILDKSKLKESADDNFKFHENSRKFSKRVENTVGKGEIAHYEQFLLFPQCFQKACFPGASKGVIKWEWVKIDVTFLYLKSITVHIIKQQKFYTCPKLKHLQTTK